VAKTAADAAQLAATNLAAAKEAAGKNAGDEALAKAAADAEKAKTDADAVSADAVVKQKAAEQAAVDAQAKVKETEDAKIAAEKNAVDTDAKLKRVQAAKAAADKQVADTTKANAPTDKNVAYISTPIRLRIVGTPLKLTAAAPANALKQGEKLELPVSIERLYGFAEDAEITLEVPNGVAGLTITKVAIAKDAKDGKFEVAAAKDATPGDHAVTVRAKAKFNGLDVEAVQQLVLKVEKVEPAQ
jgi:hypothetical protein